MLCSARHLGSKLLCSSGPSCHLVAHGHEGARMVLSMPVLRVEEAWRLSVDTSARVTLTLRVTPSGEEGVGASASSVSRLCPAHAMRICVQPCGLVHHCPRAQWFCWGEAQALASDAWHRSLLVCSLCRQQPGAVAYLGGSTRVAQKTWAQRRH